MNLFEKKLLYHLTQTLIEINPKTPTLNCDHKKWSESMSPKAQKPP